mmetsp:Transcript_113447/g.316917  ORF Transcript_113447/g.316917 Transcript_113447/m.316917 type:complete len:225 (+) Transcript_113447:185-859(+)
MLRVQDGALHLQGVPRERRAGGGVTALEAADRLRGQPPVPRRGAALLHRQRVERHEALHAAEVPRGRRRRPQQRLHPRVRHSLPRRHDALRRSFPVGPDNEDVVHLTGRLCHAHRRAEGCALRDAPDARVEHAGRHRAGDRRLLAGASVPDLLGDLPRWRARPKAPLHAHFPPRGPGRGLGGAVLPLQRRQAPRPRQAVPRLQDPNRHHGALGPPFRQGPGRAG